MDTKQINRINWIDISKGIGAILVIFTHSYNYSKNQYTPTFLIQTFFFLSGYVYSPKYNKLNIGQFIKKKCRTILVPYFIFSIITFIFWIFYYDMLNNQKYVLSVFINIFTAQGSLSYIPYNPALWFVPCLFLVEIMFNIISRKNSLDIVGILLVLSSFIGYTMYLFMDSTLFWSFDVAFTGLVFYGLGYIVRNEINIKLKSKLKSTLVLIIAVILGVLICNLNGYISLSKNSYGNYLYFYIGSITGILAIIIFSVLCEDIKILNELFTYAGKNSFYILGLHIPIKRHLQNIAQSIFSINIETVESSIVIAASITIVTFIIIKILIDIKNITLNNISKRIINYDISKDSIFEMIVNKIA